MSTARIEPLAKSGPSNAVRQRNLTISYSEVGKVLFDLGRTEEALSHFNAAIQIGKAPDSSEIYWRCALAELYTSDAPGAADDVAMALKLKPVYPYYVLWLHVARARADQHDADELAANAQKIDRSQWPWPIIALFLGSPNPDETQKAAASAEQQNTRIGQSCEADFFIGVYQIGKAAPADRALFQSAMDHSPHEYIQYPAAKLELKQLDELARAQTK